MQDYVYRVIRSSGYIIPLCVYPPRDDRQIAMFFNPIWICYPVGRMTNETHDIHVWDSLIFRYTGYTCYRCYEDAVRENKQKQQVEVYQRVRKYLRRA